MMTGISKSGHYVIVSIKWDQKAIRRLLPTLFRFIDSKHGSNTKASRKESQERIDFNKRSE